MKESSNIGKLIGGTILILGLSLFGGFDRQAKAIDNDPPSTSQTVSTTDSSNPLHLFIEKARDGINYNSRSILALERRFLVVETMEKDTRAGLKSLEDRIVTLEQPKLDESTATPEVPEVPSPKPSLVKRVGKSILEFSLFKGLVYLITK